MSNSRKLFVLTFAGLVALLCAGAVALFRPPELAVEVSVLQASDPMLLGRPNEIELEVANHGNVALDPVYSVQWDRYPFVWAGPSGLIGPGERQQVRLKTQNYEAMPPPAAADDMRTGAAGLPIQSVPFVVRVNNAGDARYWTSPPWTASMDRQAIVNGDFSDWSPLTFAMPGQIPVGWQDFSSHQPPDVTIARPTGNSGLTLEVHKAPSPPDWAQAALVRRIPVQACPVISIALGQATSYETSDGNNPLQAAGVEIFSDNYPKRSVWVVKSIGSRHYTLSNGTVIWETRPNSTGTISANVREALTWLGAERSDWANIKIFLSVHRLAPKLDQFAEIRAVSCSPSA